MSATAPRIAPKPAPPPVAQKNVSRSGAAAQRKRPSVLSAVAPLRENPSTRVSVTLNKSQTRNAIIQTVQPPADVAAEVVAPVDLDTGGGVESQEIGHQAQP